MTFTDIIHQLSDRAIRSPGQSLFVFIFILPILYIAANEVVRYRARIPHIKGPRGLPVIGNFWDIRVNAAEKYRQWSEEYGDVYQIMLGNIPVVVVNSAAAAKSIFSIDGRAMSSRPEFNTYRKHFSAKSAPTIGTSPMSDSLKRSRKTLASALNKPSIAKYVSALDFESRQLIRDLYHEGHAGQTPIDPFPPSLRLPLSLTLSINWGVRFPTRDMELYKEMSDINDEAIRYRSTTGGNLQDYIPILRLNPFSSHSSRARRLNSRRERVYELLNDGLAERMASGTAGDCLQASLWTDKKAPLSPRELRPINFSTMLGGQDVFPPQLAWIIAFLSQHPEIQQEAYSEISKIHKLDEGQPLCDAMDDRSCHYVVLLVKELLRLFTVQRLGLPHANIEDLSYKGLTIPKGSITFLNIFACNQDKTLWKDPEVFRPERWSEQPEAPLFSYGVGSRMCVATQLMNRLLYLVVIRLIGSFHLVEDEPVDCHHITGAADVTLLATSIRPYKTYFIPRDPVLLAASLRKDEA